MDTLYTGGAEGADYEFLIHAAKKGHNVVVCSFPNHKRKVIEYQNLKIKEFSESEFQTISSNMKSIASILNRVIPTDNKNTYQLLFRNYFQANKTDSLYVISYMEPSMPKNSVQIKGGSAWAPQTFVFLRKSSLDEEKMLNLFFYCQTANQWYQAMINHQNLEWNLISAPPKPVGLYTGIGARELTENGKLAIQQLYE